MLKKNKIGVGIAFVLMVIISAVAFAVSKSDDSVIVGDVTYNYEEKLLSEGKESWSADFHIQYCIVDKDKFREEDDLVFASQIAMKDVLDTYTMDEAAAMTAEELQDQVKNKLVYSELIGLKAIDVRVLCIKNAEGEIVEDFSESVSKMTCEMFSDKHNEKFIRLQ